MAKPYNGADVESLMAMLRTRRPHKSKAERAFVTQWLEPLGIERDGFGNVWKTVEGAGADVMWSSHVDTIHDKGGQQLIRKHNDVVTVPANSKSNCLGADDTAGVWLMREMILAGMPGTYVFHRGEECGGLGSDYVRAHETKRLEGIRAAIALDRAGYDDVLTHQMCQRGCSDEFAAALAAGLGENFKPDDGGVFTDTANYFDVIPECTNVSVGYHAQHTRRESLDVAFVCDLRAKLLLLDVAALPTVRDHTAPDESDFGDWYNDYRDSDGRGGYYDLSGGGYGSGGEYGAECDRIARACRLQSDAVATLLVDFGISADEIEEYLESAGLSQAVAVGY